MRVDKRGFTDRWAMIRSDQHTGHHALFMDISATAPRPATTRIPWHSSPNKDFCLFFDETNERCASNTRVPTRVQTLRSGDNLLSRTPLDQTTRPGETHQLRSISARRSRGHSRAFSSSTLSVKDMGLRGEWQVRDALRPFCIWQRPHLHGRILT
jgi:hypothetical protein